MPVSKLFIIGNLTVPSSWIALLLGFLISYVAIRALFGKSDSDRVADAFFWHVLVWKLSVLLTDFSSVLANPLSIIYFHGGTIGFFLGLAVAFMKLLWDYRKGLFGMSMLVTAWIMAQTVFQIAMAVLNPGDAFGRWTTVVIFTLFFVIYWLKRTTLSAGQWLLLSAAVHLFGAAFQPEGVVNIAFIVTVVVCLALGILFRTIPRSEEIA